MGHLCIGFFALFGVCDALNFTGTEAAGAHVQFLGRAVDHSADRLDIGTPGSFIANVRVADAHTGGYAFAANVTTSSHGNTSFVVVSYFYILADGNKNCKIFISADCLSRFGHCDKMSLQAILIDMRTVG